MWTCIKAVSLGTYLGAASSMDEVSIGRKVSGMIRSGANYNDENPPCYTLLIEAIESWNTEMVLPLILGGALLNERSGPNRYTALHFATIRENIQAVRYLVLHGADIDLGDIDGRTALMIAAEQGLNEIAAILIDSGAKVDLFDESGFSALMKAARTGHTAIVSRLLDAGVDPNSRKYFTSALHYTAIWGRTDTMRLLISRGAKIYNELLFAVRFGHADAASVLIANGATVTKAALMEALKKGNNELANMLIQAGADTTDIIQPNDVASRIRHEGISSEFRRMAKQSGSIPERFRDVNDLTDTDWLDDKDLTSESDEELLQLAIAESMRPLSAFEVESSVYRDYQPGRVGIENLGSTCYLASAIQVLGHSSRFLEILFSTKFVRPNAIQEAFVKIMHDMWSVRAEEPLNPTALLRALHEFRNGRGFTPDASEDAHEAIRIILGQLSDASRIDGEETAFDKLFSYTVSRPVRCNACGEKRSKLDTEQDIWLAIPSVVEGDDDPVVTLNDCFEATKQTEVIPDFKCELCNKQQDASAESTIASGGDVLLISLRRFPELYKKIHTKVEYPLILEISDSSYNLIGIIHHLGETLSGGHYVSQFRSDVQDQWFHANDLYVLPGTPIKTVSDTAYILIYQRIN